jgi:hypothetical protein
LSVYAPQHRMVNTGFAFRSRISRHGYIVQRRIRLVNTKRTVPGVLSCHPFPTRLFHQ